MPEGYSERPTVTTEEVGCPLCNEGRVSVTFTSAYMSWQVSRISAGAKRTRYFHDPKVQVHGKCPTCNASSADIKDILERGGKQKVSHEERVKRLRDSGLPTAFESRVS